MERCCLSAAGKVFLATVPDDPGPFPHPQGSPPTCRPSTPEEDPDQALHLTARHYAQQRVPERGAEGFRAVDLPNLAQTARSMPSYRLT